MAEKTLQERIEALEVRQDRTENAMKSAGGTLKKLTLGSSLAGVVTLLIQFAGQLSGVGKGRDDK